jgi:hypothetical protein
MDLIMNLLRGLCKKGAVWSKRGRVVCSTIVEHNIIQTKSKIVKLSNITLFELNPWPQ